MAISTCHPSGFAWERVSSQTPFEKMALWELSRAARDGSSQVERHETRDNVFEASGIGKIQRDTKKMEYRPKVAWVSGWDRSAWWALSRELAHDTRPILKKGWLKICPKGRRRRDCSKLFKDGDIQEVEVRHVWTAIQKWAMHSCSLGGPLYAYRTQQIQVVCVQSHFGRTSMRSLGTITKWGVHTVGRVFGRLPDLIGLGYHEEFGSRQSSVGKTSVRPLDTGCLCSVEGVSCVQRHSLGLFLEERRTQTAHCPHYPSRSLHIKSPEKGRIVDRT